MKERQEQTASASAWQKTQYTNLVRYVPSGTVFARFRVRGKLVRKALETTDLGTAKRKLAELETKERGAVKDRRRGKMTFGEALEIYRQRISSDPTLKPRTKDYFEQRVVALRKSWPDLEATDIRRISVRDCEKWAEAFSEKYSPNAYNHTLSILRHVIEIAVKQAVRYENPARELKRMREKPKRLTLPEFSQFDDFVKTIADGGSGWSEPCADLVRFLAYGGFRKMEAAFITWVDVDFTRGKIIVRGDPHTATKNGEVREVPMIPEMRGLLERMRAERLHESPETPVMRVRECQKAMDTAAKKIEMPRVTHHDLRHLFATRCIESGVDIPTVSRWLGHKDGGALAMKVYGHLRDQHSTDMAQKVTFSSQSHRDNASVTTPGGTI
jgi:integrase